MRRAAFVCSAVLLALLVGCSAAAPTQPAPTPVPAPVSTYARSPVEVAPVRTVAEARDAAYLSVLRNEGIFDGASAETMIDVGKKLCAALDAGNSRVSMVSATMRDGNLGAYEAGYLVGAATAAYCPEHA